MVENLISFTQALRRSNERLPGIPSSQKSTELTTKLMRIIVLIQNIKHLYIVVSRKYTNFVCLFFLKRVPDKINANLRSKKRDTNKCDGHSSKLVPKSLHAKHKMLFKNKHT